jgi:hypothetical protein
MTTTPFDQLAAKLMEQAVEPAAKDHLARLVWADVRKHGEVVSRWTEKRIIETKRVRFSDGSVAIYERKPADQDAPWGAPIMGLESTTEPTNVQVSQRTVFTHFASFSDGRAVQYERCEGSLKWQRMAKEKPLVNNQVAELIRRMMG